MKILITSKHLTSLGGIQNYVNLLIENLENDGYTISHFCHGLEPKYDVYFILPFIYPIQILKFQTRLKTFNPDIVHFNPSLSPAGIIRDLIYLNIAKTGEYPVLFFIRGWNWSYYKRIKKSDILREKFVKNLTKADRILVLSEDFKEALVEIGIDQDMIGLTSTMVESESYLPKKKSFDGPYNILFCARMATDKGPYELMKSIPRVVEKEKRVDFIFMGDGPELENLKNKAVEMDIEEYVTFTGYKTGEEKHEIYKKSHLFVFPTYHGEGFPNVVLEAMAAGLPVITTQNAGLKRLMEEGKNGYFLSSMPSEPKEIANKVLELVQNPSMMEEMSEYNLKKAKGKYDVEAVTKEIEKIYMDIIDNYVEKK